MTKIRGSALSLPAGDTVWLKMSADHEREEGLVLVSTSHADGVTVDFSHGRLLIGLDGRMLSDIPAWEVSRFFERASRRNEMDSSRRSHESSLTRRLIWKAASGLSDECWTNFIHGRSLGSAVLAQQLRAELAESDISQCLPTTADETMRIRSHPWSYYVFHPDGYPARLISNAGTTPIQSEGSEDGREALASVKLSPPKRSQTRSLKIDKITCCVEGRYGCKSTQGSVIHNGFVSEDSARTLAVRLQGDPAVLETLKWLQSLALTAEQAEEGLGSIISSQLQLTVAFEECPAVRKIRDLYDRGLLDYDQAEEHLARASKAHDHCQARLEAPPQVASYLNCQPDEITPDDPFQSSHATKQSRHPQQSTQESTENNPRTSDSKHHFLTEWTRLPGQPKVSIIFTTRSQPRDAREGR